VSNRCVNWLPFDCCQLVLRLTIRP
jgi:hypothetical protein